MAVERLAGGLVGVLAAAAGESSPDVVAVLVLLLVGLVVTMLGLSLLMGRPRHPAPAPVGAADPRPGTPDDRGCDWELHVDTGAGAPVVLRRASGRGCCIHTIRLRALDPLPAEPDDTEHLTWSGHDTRVGSRSASTRTRRDAVTAGASPRPLGLAVSGAVRREPGPTITTSDDGDADATGHAERLWLSHLRTLQARDVRTRPDDATVTAESTSTERQQVEIGPVRGCVGGHHHLRVDARLRAAVTGTSTGAPTGALEAPRVAAWVDGDMVAAATDVSAASPDARVEPLDDDPPGVAVTGAANARSLAVVLSGAGTTETVDAGFVATLGTSAAVRVAVGPPAGEEADGRVTVTVDHDLVVTVAPGDTHPGPERLQCACAPAYEVRLGELPPGGSVPSSPAGRVVVDGRAYLLRRVRGATSDTPSRWVVDGASHRGAPTDEVDVHERGSEAGAGPAADGSRAGAGQHLDGAAGRADGHAAGGTGD